MLFKITEGTTKTWPLANSSFVSVPASQRQKNKSKTLKEKSQVTQQHQFIVGLLHTSQGGITHRVSHPNNSKYSNLLQRTFNLYEGRHREIRSDSMITTAIEF